MNARMQFRIGCLLMWAWLRPWVGAGALMLWAFALAVLCGSAYADDDFEDRVQGVTANSEAVLWGRIHDLEDRLSALEGQTSSQKHATRARVPARPQVAGAIPADSALWQYVKSEPDPFEAARVPDEPKGD